MTITIAPETEALLRHQADDEGQDVNTVADALLRAALEWQARAQAQEIRAIQTGLEAAASGRVRPFAEVAAEMRAKYHLPTHLSDEELSASK